MRIALVSYEFPPDTAVGGIATYSEQVAELLGSAGHSVEVFAASGTRGGTEERASYRVHRIHGLDRKTFPDEAAKIFGQRNALQAFDVVEGPEIWAEARKIREQYPEVAHVVKLHTPTELVRTANYCKSGIKGWFRHNISQARIAAGALWRGRKPPAYVHRLAAQWLNETEIESIEREYTRECDLAVAPSQAMLDWAESNWSIPSNQRMLVPNPYIPREELLKVKLRPAGKVIGFMGRLEYRKGIADLVEAIPQILEADPEVRVRIVGKPLWHPGTVEPFDTYIRRRLRRYMDRVELVGGRPLAAMPEEYAQIDICIFPSIWENFPNVCLEAMAAGRAVVGSTAGGMAEMLRDGAGILIPPHSPQRIAEAALQFLKSPELRIAAGEKARQTVLDRYSAAAILPIVEESYETAIQLNRVRRLN
jgi:glycosyltransferase involved in cell wall biosynthesis